MNLDSESGHQSALFLVQIVPKVINQKRIGSRIRLNHCDIHQLLQKRNGKDRMQHRHRRYLDCGWSECVTRQCNLLIVACYEPSDGECTLSGLRHRRIFVIKAAPEVEVEWREACVGRAFSDADGGSAGRLLGFEVRCDSDEGISRFLL